MSDSYYDNIANEIWTWSEKMMIDMYMKRNDPNTFEFNDSNDLTYIKGFTMSECKDKFPVYSLNILSIACERLVEQQKVSLDTSIRRMIAYIYNQELVKSVIIQVLSMKRKDHEDKYEQELVAEEKLKQEKRKLKKEQEEILKKQKNIDIQTASSHSINRISPLINNEIKKSNIIQSKKSNIVPLGNHQSTNTTKLSNKILSYFVRLPVSTLPVESENDENNISNNSYNTTIECMESAASGDCTLYGSMEKVNTLSHHNNPNDHDVATIINTVADENLNTTTMTINERILTTLDNDAIKAPQSSKASLDEFLLDKVGKLIGQCFEDFGGEVEFNVLFNAAVANQWQWKDIDGQVRSGITTEELRSITEYFANGNRIMIDGDTLLDI